MSALVHESRSVDERPTFKDQPQREVARALGKVFAAKPLELPIGEWTGPVTSGFGLHLVFVDKRTDGGVAKLEPCYNKSWRPSEIELMD